MSFCLQLRFLLARALQMVQDRDTPTPTVDEDDPPIQPEPVQQQDPTIFTEENPFINTPVHTC